MTAPDLDVLESLLAKATPGPWWYDFKGGSGAAIIRSDTVRTVLHCGTVYPQDARLIVAAVNALPALLAYVRELELHRAPIYEAESAQIARGAALAMRERCAQACEALKVNRPSDPLANAFDGACETCAAAVRALEP